MYLLCPFHFFKQSSGYCTGPFVLPLDHFVVGGVVLEAAMNIQPFKKAFEPSMSVNR